MIRLLRGGELVHTWANPISHFEAIKGDVLGMIQIMREMNDEGRSVLALHHAQVSQKPFDFFVLNMEKILSMDPNVKMFHSPVVCNARIVGTDVPRAVLDAHGVTDYKGQPKQPMEEGCASFPHRTFKRVDRYFWITVEFEYPDAKDSTKFHKQRLDLPSIYAQIFQHEIDHGKGKNIYFEHGKS
jgi:peptide deformylase